MLFLPKVDHTKVQCVHIALIIVASVVSFVPGISDDLVFDDIPAVKENKDITTDHPGDIFLHDFWGSNITASASHKSYRPLTTLSFWAQSCFDGKVSAAKMKQLNLLLHVEACVLFYVLCHCLGSLDKGSAVKTSTSKNSRLQSLSAALIFAVHPVHTESVVSIVGRADLLYSILFLLSSILALKWRPRGWPGAFLKYCALFLLTFISMLCKEQGITFVGFLLVIEFAKLRSKKNKVDWNYRFVLFVFYCAASAAILVFFRLWIIQFEKPKFQRGDNPAAAETDMATRWLTFNYLYFVNFLILLSPTWLCFDWALGCVSLVTLSDSRIILILILWIFLISLAVKTISSIKTSSSLLFATSLLTIPFIPSSNLFVYVGFVIAERNLYLSVAGYAYLTTIGLTKLTKLTKPKNKSSAIYLLFNLTLLALFLRSRSRSLEWRTEMELFVSGLTVCPNNAKVHYNIAKKMANKGHQESAVLFYKEALRLEPRYEHAINNLANILKTTEDTYNVSRSLLERAVVLNPAFAAAFMNLAIVEQAMGDYLLSEQHYLHALSLRHPYSDCEYNLANLYLKTGRMDEAESFLGLAMARGHALATANLLIFLDQRGRFGEAEVLAREAVAWRPANPEYKFHLANALGQQEKYAESAESYLGAIVLEPKPLYFGNLGVLYHRWGKHKLAIKAYSKALELNPRMQSTRINLEKLKKITNNIR